MAGDWIKMRLELQSHPKVVRILSATGADKFRVVGGLHAVWSVFDQHSEDGVLHGYTPDLMDHIIGWQGFSSAMIGVGWLEYDGDNRLIMPGFECHNGKSGKRRAEDQKRKREARESAICPQSVRNLSAECHNESVTREEKRREEKKRGDSDTDVSGDKSPEGASARCWRLWLELVGDTQANRKVLGSMIKDHGEEAVADAVARTYAKGPADPVSYLRGCLKPKRRFQA